MNPFNREKNMKIEAVLFDLDNTLIMFDEKKFFETYSKKLYLSFQDLLSPQEFIQRLLSSTQVMTNNDGTLTNAEFFIHDFAKGLSSDKNELWQRFEYFYQNEFEQFKFLMKPLKNTYEIITSIKDKGFKVIIASNPMFPTNVQLIRLRWAGLAEISFDLITSAENSTFCKPNPDYYSEICEKINIKPENCLMVGNDAFNDMIASKTGMKTYLTKNSESYSIDLSRELAKNNKLEMPEPDFKGSLDSLLNILDENG